MGHDVGRRAYCPLFESALYETRPGIRLRSTTSYRCLLFSRNPELQSTARWVRPGLCGYTALCSMLRVRSYPVLSQSRHRVQMHPCFRMYRYECLPRPGLLRAPYSVENCAHRPITQEGRVERGDSDVSARPVISPVSERRICNRPGAQVPKVRTAW